MDLLQREECELTILMPCLDEEKTLEPCIRAAKAFLKKYDITGEVLVVDNGSQDASAKVAKRQGARVVTEPKKGYGSALIAGLANAKGKYVIMGDCDTTYDFMRIEPMYRMLREGVDVVIGNRFAGGMEPGAMSMLHRIGVEMLSQIGRWRYHCKVRDFHCGLRGISRLALSQIVFCQEGMEFATEMIAVSCREGFDVGEVSVGLRKCRVAGRKAHLKVVRDGVRHLKYMLG